MAIEFSEHDPSQWDTWIPDYEGERELAKDDPDRAFSVDIRFMTKAERDRHERVAKQTLLGKMSEGESQEYLEHLFRSHVRNVRNFTVGGNPIENSVGLYRFLMEAGEADLAGDIVLAISKRSRLEAGLAKKLRSGSDSGSSPQTTKDCGGAQDAIREYHPDIQAALTSQIKSYAYQTTPSEVSEVATESPMQSTTSGNRT